jgi:Z1 domain
MQMGRWFGYRPGYLDLCRLFTTPDLAEWYRHITLASDELRREFDHMAEIRGTPSEYGLRVRTHPDGLIITSVNKMRTGTDMRLSYSGTISESVAFDSTPAVIESNFQRFSRFLEDVRHTSDLDKERDNFLWKDVHGAKIKALLTDIKTHPDSWKANSQLLAEYVQKKIAEGELTSWTVVLISKSSDGQVLIGGEKIEPSTRTFVPDQGKLSIGRLVNPVDEIIDFDEAKRREALARTVSYWKANPGRIKNEPDRAAGPVIREMRSPNNGLLLIYPLTPPAGGDETPVMGFAVSFPKSDNQTAIQYKVNNIFWDQEFGVE